MKKRLLSLLLAILMLFGMVPTGAFATNSVAGYESSGSEKIVVEDASPTESVPGADDPDLSSGDGAPASSD